MAIPRQRIFLPRASWRKAIAGRLRGDLWEGDDIAAFEQEFAERIGVSEAAAVPSGRAGLRFILDALDLEPGCPIICSAFGYPVVPHLVKSLGFQLRLVDCELQTLGMDPAALNDAIDDQTGAVIATHLYGVPCRIDEIAEICKKRGVSLVEDCAHCLGASVGGRQAGAFGRLAYFSFETSKMINTMGGGMVTTDEPELGQFVRARSSEQEAKNGSWLAKRLLRTTFEATVTSPLPFNAGVYPALRVTSKESAPDDRFASGYHGDEVTMRGRMGRYTNYQAQLGRHQLATLGPRQARRIANARRLIDRLSHRVRFQEPAGPDAQANYMLVTALFPKMREMAAGLLRRGVDSKHHYMRDCTHLLQDGERFVNAAQTEAEALHLPAFPELSTAQIDRIADQVLTVVEQVEGSGKAAPHD